MGERIFTEHLIRRGAAYPRLIRKLSLLTNKYEEDLAEIMHYYIYTIREYLTEQDVPEELLEPLFVLGDALTDLRYGLHSPLFKPNEKKTSRLPQAYAKQMGRAALAVSIAPRNMRKNILKRAAKKLMTPETKLENFRRNLLASDHRIKSQAAIIPFYMYIISNLSQEERESLSAAPWVKKLKPDIACAEDIVRRLRPVPEKYQDV